MSLLQSLDVYVADSLKTWDLYSTALALLIGTLRIYPVFFPSEPDTHPLLLARQSIAAPIRRKGESALYRASEVPHGYSLRTGLDVKDAAAPRWSSGRDGDLRDVWREVAKAGGAGPDGREVPRGLIMRVFGKEVAEHEIEDLSKEINILGDHFKQNGITKLAIYLPNSVEYLLAIFACAFYGVSPILFPFDLSHTEVFYLLNLTLADGLVAAAGSLPLTDVGKQCSNLKLLTWVVEKTSRHVDWNAEASIAQSIKVSVWHELVDEQSSTASKTLPQNGDMSSPPDIITIWQSSGPKPNAAEVVAFTHANLVSGISGLLTSLPSRQRFTSSDLVLPADSFCNTYVLLHTFAALFTHASIAINSVAGFNVALSAAVSAVKPTVIIASAETLVKFHTKAKASVSTTIARIGMAAQSRAMAAGRMPTDTFLYKLLIPSAASNTPGHLRLLLTCERIRADAPSLTSTMLSDLRILTRARIAYALTSAKVAGAIAQTNIFDYRLESDDNVISFGGPLASVEVKLINSNETEIKGSAQGVVGRLVVSGPAVAGGSYDANIRCAVRSDGTIAYAR